MGVRYELTLTEAGQCMLTLDDELMWSSDGDDDFVEEFGEVVESGEIEDVAAWLVDEGYIPPRVEIDFADETVEAGSESGWFEKLDADADDDDDADEDDEGDSDNE